MRNNFIFFLILGLLFSQFRANDLLDGVSEDGVEIRDKDQKSLTFIQNEDHFYYVIDNSRNVLTLFSREDENCVDCQIALKEIEKTIKQYNGDCSFIFIDCSLPATHSICETYEVARIPTVSLLSEQLAVYEFTEFLVSANLIKFIDKYSIEKTIQASSDQEIDYFINEYRVVVIGFFTPENSEDLRAFRRAAANLLFEFKFIEVQLKKNNRKTVEKYNIAENSVVLFKEIAGERSHHSLPSPFSRKQLTAFIYENSPVHIYEGTNKNFQKLESLKKPILAIFYSSSEKLEENQKSYFDFQLAAEKYREYFSFTFSVLSQVKHDEYEDLKRWGFTLTKFPIVLIYNIYSREAFTLDESTPIDLFSLNKFCSEFLSGKLEPKLIKQSLPSSNDQRVKVVVFDNYRKIVHDQTKDVVVLFYLPEEMCKHCGDFIKAFEDAVDLLSSNPLFNEVVFAKMDMYQNQYVPGLDVYAFPSLFYFPKYNKYNEVTFAQKRTVENVMNWLTVQVSDSSASTIKNFEDLTLLDDHII